MPFINGVVRATEASNQHNRQQSINGARNSLSTNNTAAQQPTNPSTTGQNQTSNAPHVPTASPPAQKPQHSDFAGIGGWAEGLGGVQGDKQCGAQCHPDDNSGCLREVKMDWASGALK